MAVFVGAVLFFRGDRKEPTPTGDTSGLIVGRNAIYVAEQAPSRTVLVAVARLEKPGFVVIHEDNAGPLRRSFNEASKPGKILGTSGVLPAGETKNLTPIALSRMTKDGETLYAMLHFDDGDGVFDPSKDKPAIDSISKEPVMMIFTVSTDASAPAAVNP